MKIEFTVLLPVDSHSTSFESPRWHEGTWWVSDFYRRTVSRVTPDGPGGTPEPTSLTRVDPDGAIVDETAAPERMGLFACRTCRSRPDPAHVLRTGLPGAHACTGARGGARGHRGRRAARRPAVNTGQEVMKPLSYAAMTACVRSRAPSLSSTPLTWVLTVSRLR